MLRCHFPFAPLRELLTLALLNLRFHPSQYLPATFGPERIQAAADRS